MSPSITRTRVFCTFYFLPNVSGNCYVWAQSSSPGKRQKHTHISPAWAQIMPSSLQKELLVETSNFTDHGFGGKEKKMSPQKQVGNHSLLERWKCQDRWTRTPTGFLGSFLREAGKPEPSSPCLPQGYADLEVGKRSPWDFSHL